jgi:hypothetical protein
MKKVENQIIAFSYPQVNFLYWITKLHIIEYVESGWLIHPITKQNVAPVLIYRAPKFIDNIVYRITNRLLGKDGRALADKMIEYGVVEERED